MAAGAAAEAANTHNWHLVRCSTMHMWMHVPPGRPQPRPSASSCACRMTCEHHDQSTAGRCDGMPVALGGRASAAVSAAGTPHSASCVVMRATASGCLVPRAPPSSCCDTSASVATAASMTYATTSCGGSHGHCEEECTEELLIQSASGVAYVEARHQRSRIAALQGVMLLCDMSAPAAAAASRALTLLWRHLVVGRAIQGTQAARHQVLPAANVFLHKTGNDGIRLLPRCRRFQHTTQRPQRRRRHCSRCSATPPDQHPVGVKSERAYSTERFFGTSWFQLSGCPTAPSKCWCR